MQHFLDAQDEIFPIALKELREGQKRSHWMWYIFPQLKHLGHSYKAIYYGIARIEEAAAYLQHPILGQRLRKVSETILHHPENDAEVIFGFVDAMKLRSSMTLFDAVSPNDIFTQAIDKYFNGQSDNRTISIINTYGTI